MACNRRFYVNTTVKVLYRRQEGAEVGYNPKKPGRPAYIIHTYMMSETRLILECEVLPGKQSAASYSLPWPTETQLLADFV